MSKIRPNRGKFKWWMVMMHPTKGKTNKRIDQKNRRNKLKKQLNDELKEL